MLNLDFIGGMDSDALDNLKVEKEKELQTANHHLGIVTQTNHMLGRQILELRIKKKDADIMMDKARHNVRALESDIKILTSAFWRSRREHQ